MKKLLVYFSIMLLSSCGAEVGPKYNVLAFGSFIKEVGNDFYLFSKYECDPVFANPLYLDTLSVDSKLHHGVFFVKIIPQKLHKNFRNLDMVQCSLREIYSRGDTLRKQVPGFGERDFLVVDNVVGVR